MARRRPERRLDPTSATATATRRAARSQPTFSPDGGALAWAAGDGIHVAAVPAFAAGCTLDGATPNPPLVIPGGTEPDWGPADVPRARAAGRPERRAPAPSRPRRSVSVKVLSASRRNGVTVRVKVAGKGSLRRPPRRGSKVVGKASKTVKKAGTPTLKLRVKRTGKVTVKVTFKPASGATPDQHGHREGPLKGTVPLRAA